MEIEGGFIMKITKYFSVIVLVLLSALLTTFTLAYWAGEINGAEVDYINDANTVSIGSAKEIVTTLDITNSNDYKNKTFVPVGRVSNDQELDRLNFKFNVKWEDATKATVGEHVVGHLTSTPQLVIDNVNDYADLFEISVSTSNNEVVLNDANGVDVEVTVIFKNEPKSKAQYEQMIHEVMQLEMAFLVETTH